MYIVNSRQKDSAMPYLQELSSKDYFENRQNIKRLLGAESSQSPFDYCVSPSPKNWVFGFFRLGLYLALGVRTCDLLGRDRGLIGTWTWA